VTDSAHCKTLTQFKTSLPSATDSFRQQLSRQRTASARSNKAQDRQTDTLRCAEIGQPGLSAALLRCQANTYRTVHPKGTTFQPTVLKASQFNTRFYQFRRSRRLYCSMDMWSHGLVERCLDTAGWTTATTIRKVERRCDDEA
jgi:hypothetical protein